MIVEMEGGHPNLEPRPNRSGALQKGEQPIGLNLQAFAIQDGRREIDLVFGIEAADVTATIFDNVASDAVVVIDHPPTRNDRILLRARWHPVFFEYGALGEACQAHAEVLDVG